MQVHMIFENQEKITELGGVDEFLENFNGPFKGGIDAEFYDDVAEIHLHRAILFPPATSNCKRKCKHFHVLRRR